MIKSEAGTRIHNDCVKLTYPLPPEIKPNYIDKLYINNILIYFILNSHQICYHLKVYNFQIGTQNMSKSSIKKTIKTSSLRISATLTLACYLFLNSTVVFSDSYSDAKKAQGQAFQNYYNQLQNNGNPTPDEVKSLKSQIMDPATSNTLKARQQEMDAISPVPKTPSGLGGSSDLQKGKDRRKKKLAQLTKNKGTATNQGQNSGRSRTPTSSGQSRPEYKLDGSKIPKTLEFPGK